MFPGHPKHGVLAGPRAAGILGWDGFQPEDPGVWLVPHDTGTSADGVIRTRRWAPAPREVEGVPLSSPALVLAHLLVGLTPRQRWNGDRDPLSCANQVELALEYCLRHRLVAADCWLFDKAKGRGSPTRTLIARLLRQRGPAEPPTESYAETRLIQQLRHHGVHRVFRQIPLKLDRQIVNRIDVVVPYRAQGMRPVQFDPFVGIPIEVDGREFHELNFEKDRQRSNNHTLAGARLLVVTPSVIERQFGRFSTELDLLRRQPPKGTTQTAIPAFG